MDNIIQSPITRSVRVVLHRLQDEVESSLTLSSASPGDVVLIIINDENGSQIGDAVKVKVA